jgi:hypothetical protein
MVVNPQDQDGKGRQTVLLDKKHHPDGEQRQKPRDLPNRLDDTHVVTIEKSHLHSEVVQKCPPTLEPHHGGHAEDQKKAQHGTLPGRNFWYGEHRGSVHLIGVVD